MMESFIKYPKDDRWHRTEEVVSCELCKKSIRRLGGIYIGAGLYLCKECYDGWR
ncbi:MAG: hypothetical protein ACUVWK_01560 [Nitrososphaerales archaeon]